MSMLSAILDLKRNCHRSLLLLLLLRSFGGSVTANRRSTLSPI